MGALRAFVTRRMDPEAAENSGLRRWRRRANTVAGGEFVPSGETCKRSDADAASRKGQDGDVVKKSWAKRAVKGLWGRVHNRDGRAKDTEATGTALRRHGSNNLSPGVRTQLLISTPMTSQIPAQYTQEGQRHEIESFSPIANPVSPSTTITTTHFGSPLTRVPHHTHARSPTPDWILASTSPRISDVPTAIESPLASDLSVDPYHELIDSIERFHFALLVDSITIDNICGDIRDVIEITSNNLLTVGCDLQRLLVIWRKITSNAANVAALETLEPRTLVSKEHVAKACVDMKNGLQSYRDWVDIVARNKRIAQSQNAISHEWCAALNDKMKALDVLEALDFDDVVAQVELVMRKYIGAEEEVATTGGPAAPASVTNTSLPSAIARCRHTSPSLSRRLFSTLARSRCGSATPQACSPSTSRYPQLCQSPTPPAPTSRPSLPTASVHCGSQPTPAVARAPSHTQPTSTSLRSTASATNAPSYARSTKASLGWRQTIASNSNSASGVASASQSHRPASATHGLRATRVQLQRPPNDEHRGPSPDLEHAPPIPPKSIKRLIPRASSPLPAHLRSDSALSLSLNDVATTRRSTCSSIYTNSKLPVKANGTSNPGFLRPAIADVQTEHDANTPRVHTPRPVRDELVVGVDHGRDPSITSHDMAVRMDEIRSRMSRMTADMKARKLEREKNVSTQDGPTEPRDDAHAQEG